MARRRTWAGCWLAAAAVVCCGCVTADALRHARFAIEHDLSVYTINGTGDDFTEVMKRTKTGETPREPLWDGYFQPALAPDGVTVACIRFRNYTRLSGNDPPVLPRQSSEIVIVRTTAGKSMIQVVHSVPGQRGVVYRLGSPIWSLDGRGLFFMANNRILAYWLDTTLTQTITDLPDDAAAGISEDFITTTYLRLSRDGQEIFALLHSLGSSDYSVWRIHWATGSRRQVWKGSWWGRSVHRVDPPLPAEFDDVAVEALFGSREFPVLAPRFSLDRRFYFFTRYRPGFFGRLWIAGYDVEAHREFTVRTLRSRLLWK